MNSNAAPSQYEQTPWLDQPMLLKELIAVDDGDETRLGISEAFGDRFLCSTNPLYRRLREMCISCGFSYSTSVDPISRDYSALPLLMLQDIIDGGVIPVFDNASVLRRLLVRSPHLTVPPNFVLSSLRRNHTLHESAHCVAYRYLSPFLGSGKATAKQYVISCLFCEAYATAVERIAALDADDEMHKLIFSTNSYIDVYKSTTNAFGAVAAVLGLDQVLLISVSVLLRLNRGIPWNDADIRSLVTLQRTQETLESEALVMTLLAERLSASLNPVFVNSTTPLFFRYMGYEKEYRELCRGDILADGDEDMARYAALLGTLIEVTCEGGTLAHTTGSSVSRHPATENGRIPVLSNQG